ncbi:MAG TPA: hypothetical protein VD791_11035 [Burkholderiales bacterium]|nr:hypothetical protein [Burkholderiales bacterium]
MAQLSKWVARGAVAIALALTMTAVTGCASNGADADRQDQQWDRPPGWVPFSA